METKVNEIIEELDEKEKQSFKKKLNELDLVNDIIPILLKRVTTDNVGNLAVLLKHSVLPSISPETDDEAESLFSQIEENPKLLFEKSTQTKIEDFIGKRYAIDKKTVIDRTSDISKFVVMMGEYLNEAISTSGSSSKNVLNIKEKIQAIDMENGGFESLMKLQEELVNAASSIEQEMENATNKLQSGKTQIEELEEKIKNLEDELNRTKTESRKDHLTNLLTRRAFNEEMKKIESSYERNDILYAVVFFDLDYFKKINDTYGHKCGDVVLSTFAKILDKYTRDHDIVSRYGGEEFVAIVHFKLNRELLQYLKRIKSIVTENNFVFEDKKLKITFSAGVAIRNNYENYEDTIQKADKLLYKAKESGRNKIILENGMEI